MRYEGFAPYVGRLETEAPTVAKARSNIRHQLWRDHGWNVYEARKADVEPVRPVQSSFSR